MKISRLDLDGAGSPLALVTRIFQVEPDMPIPVPLEALCERLDIVSIADMETEGFEAALITDENKSNGGILVAKGRSRQRWRFSVSHELGHFLIPAHQPGRDGKFLCSIDDLKAFDPKEQDRHRRMEMEANQFAALLLVPPHLLRIELAKGGTPDLDKLVTLAAMFDVSKQAMAQQYVTYHREAVAIIQTHHGRSGTSSASRTSSRGSNPGRASRHPLNPSCTTLRTCPLARRAMLTAMRRLGFLPQARATSCR